MKTKRFEYVYMPAIHDACDPIVVSGKPIAINSRVRVAREFNPSMYPTKVFVMIQDASGNVQSVYRSSIVPIVKL